MFAPPLPGDFQLMPTGGNLGRLIRVGQWLNGSGFADFEHVRLYVGNGQFVQAEPGGANMVHGALGAGYWSSGHIPLSGSERVVIVGAALRSVGTPYSFLDYAALATHRLHIPAPGLRSYIASTGHLICSQLVDQYYLTAGVHLFNDGRWPGYVTPGDLYQLLTGKELAHELEPGHG